MNENQMSISQLKQEYQREMRRAADGMVSRGDYTDAGVKHLENAIAIQTKLVELAGPEQRAAEQEILDQVVSTTFQVMSRRGMLKQEAAKPEAAPADTAYRSAEPVAEAVTPAVRKPAAKTVAAKEKNDPKEKAEELTDFRIEDYIVQPGQVSLAEAEAASPEVIAKLKKTVHDDFRDRFPNLIDRYEREMPHFLLYGPPGTGKSFICKGLASYMYEVYKGQDAVFYSMEIHKIKSKYQGEADKRIQAVFDDAQKRDFAIICIDEADALFSSRGADSSKPEYVSTLLTLMDGVKGKCKAMVILATNHPEKVDTALVSRVGGRSFVDYPETAGLINFMHGKAKLHPGLGADTETRERMIVRICEEARRRHFSFRNMLILCDSLADQLEKLLDEAYPGGTKERITYLPMTESQIMDVLAKVSSDYNAEEYEALKRYHAEH